MSSRPGKRLVDVLKLNSKETLDKHAQELADVASNIPAELIQTRFLRNNFLISPKSLFLLNRTPKNGYSDINLVRWNVFGIYKPPFCPMKRKEASDNYHQVSVESFVEASLRSLEISNVMKDKFSHSGTDTPPPKIRILYNLGRFASGPVLVSVCDEHPFSTSLQPLSQTYEVLVYGHHPIGTPKEIPIHELYTPYSTEETAAPPTPIRLSPTETTKCTYTVKGNFYYSIHAVSLVEVHIESPPTAVEPNIEHYLASTLQSFVVGDPVGMGKALSQREEGSKVGGGAIALRGDLDFPRVFTHLREVKISATVPDPNGKPTETKEEIYFECKKCFDNLLEKNPAYSLKRKQLKILDGSWTPESEFL